MGQGVSINTKMTKHSEVSKLQHNVWYLNKINLAIKSETYSLNETKIAYQKCLLESTEIGWLWFVEIKQDDLWISTRRKSTRNESKGMWNIKFVLKCVKSLYSSQIKLQVRIRWVNKSNILQVRTASFLNFVLQYERRTEFNRKILISNETQQRIYFSKDNFWDRLDNSLSAIVINFWLEVEGNKRSF